MRALEPARPVGPIAELVHDTFRALVLSHHFSCVGAKAALGGGTYRFGTYGEMASTGTTGGLAHDLFAFVEEQPSMVSEFTSFVASFSGPVTPTEEAFEDVLWRQLQALHDVDRPYHEWDPSVSDDPTDPGCSFSFGGRAFFVVGLHAVSSRWARRHRTASGMEHPLGAWRGTAGTPARAGTAGARSLARSGVDCLGEVEDAET